MGFKAAKAQVLECLKNGQVLHEQRNNIDVKNLLAVGDICTADVAKIILKAQGTDYSSSPHDMDGTIEVHIIKKRISNQNWYIKWYFIEPNSVFISVHR